MPSPLGSPRPSWRKSHDYIPKELWLPGSLLNTRGAGPIEQTISFTGNAAMGGLGLTENWGGMRHDRGEEAAGHRVRIDGSLERSRTVSAMEQSGRPVE